MTTEKGGQPSFILDEEKTERLLNYLRLGHYIVDACAMADVGESTYHKWRKIGEEADQLDPTERTETQQAAVEFMESVKKARATAKSFHLAKIRDDGSWQASAWWLERSFPDQWGRRERVEVTGKDDGPVIIELEFSD